ncbi:MAG: metallophosphoesterase [Phycisphaerales bacterium]|nr:metallophosphoesterase [Phycisphaerales bacterium]
MKRRDLLGSGIALGAISAFGSSAGAAETDGKFAFTSPPVVQTPLPDSISISWTTGALANCWVEWGYDRKLAFRAKAAHHGLIEFSERFHSIRIRGIKKKRIFYRIAAQELKYGGAYRIRTGETIYSDVFSTGLADPDAEKISLTITNDTHAKNALLDPLIARINALAPDFHVCNGDICDSFNSEEQLARICLTPGSKPLSGWASDRPLLYVPGNHDVRGRHAGAVVKAMSPWPLDPSDPPALNRSAHIAGRYCFALRHGPLALIGLDTGEDKPDRHPAFAGLADYEDYRRAQTQWLKTALKRPEIKSAPFLIAACHIPLRGLKGQNDGQTLKGYASYSGHGQTEWLKPLADAKCRMIISGHTHRPRIQKPDDDCPIYQVIGGGSRASSATLVRLQADNAKLQLTIEDLQAKQIHQLVLKR